MIYLDLFFTFLKIGLFTFGGGQAMIPLIQEQVVSRGWISSREMIDFIAVSESTPGPLAINVSTYVGMETAGVLGAVLSTVGMVFPSFIIILAVAKFYEKFKKSTAITGALEGLKPAVIALIASAIITVGETVFFPNGFNAGQIINSQFILSIIIFFIMSFLSIYKKINPIIIIGLSAIMGIVAGYTLNL